MPKIKKIRNRYDLCNTKILVDTNLVILFIDHMALRILELDRDRVVGTNVLLYLPYSIRQEIIPHLDNLLHIGKQKKSAEKKTQLSIETNNNSKFKIKLLPIRNINNNVLKGINLHVTCVKENNQTDYLTPQYINNLSHELRAPLFNIRSFLETLYEYNDELTLEQRSEFLEIATNETNRLNNLVKSILDFAELENKRTSDRSQSSIRSIVEEIIQLNQFIAINKRLLILKTIENIQEVIISDDGSLIRVLSNLLNNSIKFTYPKGLININTKTLQSKFLQIRYQKSVGRISIIDTGIGVSKENNKKILNRFARGNHKNHIITGSGLGLPIVNETLAKNKQKLTFSSNTRKGSSASFNLIVSEV
uniref:histidine kinase n=1 Tax=Rhodomonas salina TaxID=3034 RepID=A6MVT6_RHDSA|nr:two-component sensor kinase [Rhodomonas salina]ABO70738.1 two-component sensor kinase [Rhodomonas salina]